MTDDLSPIARPSGALAMVAMDQRDSLRTMFRDAGQPDVPDSTLVDFKLTVAEVLSPWASGFLIDREYGFEQVRERGLVRPPTGLVLAADVLDQQPGGPVEDTSLDATVVGDTDLAGVAAIKLLLIWRRDERRAARVQLARDFVQAARDRGVLSVLEPVVRVQPGESVEDAIVEAAQELSVVGQSLYKVQVPRGGRDAGPVLDAEMARLGEAITGPWVVLSQGVAPELFAGAVQAACRAGASGFLSGRALWSDVVGSPDVAGALRRVSVPRLQRLVEIVDTYATAWSDR